ncbi:suppressor of fused domain protein [Pseudonocardia sp. H11422]|uniref:suppressor of fused domain protein n=1 Tax=Pseudonocardia sp. H11422 TaxID=2835866 RepID=UPI001BDBDAE7|nr:suppressor of fused domain protein [Pseudonocardia sp. H11422]
MARPPILLICPPGEGTAVRGDYSKAGPIKYSMVPGEDEDVTQAPAIDDQEAQSDLADLEARLDVFADYEAQLTDHYEEFFGSTSMVFRDDHSSHSDDLKVNVHIYPATEDRPFLTLATCGMGLQEMNVNDKDFELRDSATGKIVPATEVEGGNQHYSRAELLLYLPSDWDFGDPDGYTPIQLLLSYARFPHRESTWLGPGHTVGSGTGFEPFFEGSLLSAAYFLPALLEHEDFFHVDLSENAHLHVLWLQPITVAERHVKRLRGQHELNKKLIENDVIDLDIDRACTVMPESRAQRRIREKAQRRRRRAQRDTPWQQITCTECHETFMDALTEAQCNDDSDD